MHARMRAGEPLSIGSTRLSSASLIALHRGRAPDL